MTARPTGAAARPAELDVDLRPLGDSGSLLITATGRRFEVDRSPAELRAAIEAFLAAPDDPPWPELAAVLRDSGGIVPANEDSGATATLTVLADPMLAPIATRLINEDESVAPLADSCSGWPAALGSTAGPVVILLDQFDAERLASLDRSCADTNLSWAPFHIDLRRGWAGPALGPGSSLTYPDVLTRRRCATQRRELGEALLSAPVLGPLRPPDSDAVTWMVAVFLAEARRWAAGRDSSLVGNELELDPHRPTVTPHPVLPVPGRATVPYRNDRLSGIDLLLDDRTGIVTNLRTITHHPSIPRDLKTVQAEVTDMGRVLPWAPNTVCGGSVFGDEQAARGSAIGESVERYCGNVIDRDQLVQASYAELTARGEHALDPARLVLYSDRQHATPGFPFVEFTPDLPVYWVSGHSLTEDRPILVPASTVYVNWYVGPFVDEPRTNYPFYAGLAAGTSLDDAIRSGLEEIVERDATMMWWANRQPLPLLEPSRRLHGLFDGVNPEHGQQYWLVELQNEFGIPVVAGVVEDAENRLAIGFGARETAEAAAAKAWAEALTLQEISRDLDNPQGRYWQAVRAGVKAQHFMKPWRRDRRYLDDYRDDFRDVGDLECQMQFYLDVRAVDRARAWTLAGERAPIAEVPSLPDRTLATYRDRIERRGYEILVVDITTSDVAPSGHRAVRVLVPGLVSNFPAAFPFHGNRRLQDGPVALGWRSEPLAEQDLELFPLPHA
ncbi:YcaO-like family protein [Microlunatus parietis]|uniref:Ribosomal protein S12 methylthiotransferase accessory factor n=1 Tax=Microlunatus parietis TaxID=682979 RepID=A0A7Y9I6T5_9ACTN|nr:YcaO-like family protein [Microlunatus parietis]NYE71061.1 ribosomal protein S12 methylthiotransferase accessory factor [Microlunatus parietis]